LLGAAMTRESRWLKVGLRIVGTVCLFAAAAIAVILYRVRHMPAPGDISRALEQHPGAYTLSLGHIGDLTLASFAYLRVPLIVAAVAFLIGAVGALALRGHRAYLTIALMMVVFFHAAHLALRTFDPYLSSRPLAEALIRAPAGRLILNGAYY